MKGDLIADYSFARPALSDVKAAGYVGIARYLAPLPNAKVLTADELAEAHALGLSALIVWETTASRAADGADAGTRDRDRANAMADGLGWPADRPVFYAVDFDANPNEVRPYFEGVQGGPRPVGVYGGIRVVDTMLSEGLASFAWQTVAWSAGQVSDLAHLYQRLTPTVPNPVEATDENVALQDDYGAWLPGSPHPQEDDLTDPQAQDLAFIKNTVEGHNLVLQQIGAAIDELKSQVAQLGAGGGGGGGAAGPLKVELSGTATPG